MLEVVKGLPFVSTQICPVVLIASGLLRICCCSIESAMLFNGIEIAIPLAPVASGRFFQRNRLAHQKIVDVTYRQ